MQLSLGTQEISHTNPGLSTPLVLRERSVTLRLRPAAIFLLAIWNKIKLNFINMCDDQQLDDGHQKKTGSRTPFKL